MRGVLVGLISWSVMAPPSTPPSSPPPQTATPPGDVQGTPEESSRPTANDGRSDGGSRTSRRNTVDLSHTWSQASGGIARPRYIQRLDPGRRTIVVHPLGHYSGVTFRGNEPPPAPARSFDTLPVQLTWTGFERDGDTSHVFVQLTGKADFEIEQRGTKVRVRLKNTRVRERNNRRRLDLRYFDTPVQTVHVVQQGRDTVLSLTLKRAAEPVIAWSDHEGPYQLLSIGFGVADEAEEPRS